MFEPEPVERRSIVEYPPEGGSVRSVERALDLLVALERAGGPLGVSELGRLTGMPKATAQRLLTVLERRGFLQKEEGRYQLGAGLVPLARAFLTGNSLTRSALPVLEELALLSGETACLYVRQGFDRIVVQRVESNHPMRYTIRVGQRLPLHVGAAGRVLAAAMPVEELRQLLDQVGPIRLASGRIVSREEFLAGLEEIRGRGIAISREERDTGVVSVAAPVVRRGRGTIAAVAVVGPPSRMTQEKVECLSVEIRGAAQRMAEGYHLHW